MGDSLRFLVYLQCVVIAEMDGDLFLVLTINETSFMKKFLSITLLLTAMFLTFSACSNDDDEIKQETKDTTYTFTYTADNPPQGITANITLFEYNDKGERVSQNAVNNVRKGHSQNFKANVNAQKVKVYLVATNGSQSEANWVQQVYYLEKGKNVEVAVTGSMRIGKTEP